MVQDKTRAQATYGDSNGNDFNMSMGYLYEEHKIYS
jgi:hypothetical protein